MISTIVIVTILVCGGAIGIFALYSPKVSQWAHEKIINESKHSH